MHLEHNGLLGMQVIESILKKVVDWKSQFTFLADFKIRFYLIKLAAEHQTNSFESLELIRLEDDGRLKVPRSIRS